MAKARASAESVFEAAMAQIAEVGWREFSMKGLAEATGRPLSEIYRELPGGRRAVLQQLGRELDDAMLQIAPGELAEMSLRERLFELMMRRLEAMNLYKPALASIHSETRRSCELMLNAACNLDRMAARLLDACGSDLRGCRARLARRALMLVYARAFTVWLADESADLAATMAELDKRLGQACGLGSKCFGRGSGRGFRERFKKGFQRPRAEGDAAAEPA